MSPRWIRGRCVRPRLGRLLAVLCLSLSAACCSTPGDDILDENSSARERAVYTRGVGQVPHILSCLTRYRTVPGGMGFVPGVRNESKADIVYSRSAHPLLGSAGCAGNLFDPDTLTLSAGDGLALFSSEGVQWRVDEGFTAAGSEDLVRSVAKSAAQQHVRIGGVAAYEEVTLSMTRSGSYYVLVKPKSPVSISPHFQLRVVVSSGYPSARTSKACYIMPPTSNDTEVDYSADLPCSEFNASVMVPFEKTETPSEYLSNKIVSDYDTMNTSNVSVAEVLIDREFVMCLSRKCLTLQVRRYDSWSNPVHSPEVTNIISVEVQGIETSMYEVVERGKSTILSDGALRKWETYQWIGNRGNRQLGNNTCNQFPCNVTKLVGPETNVVAWVVVRMDGVPLGSGSPFKVFVTGGGFHGFMVDPFYMTGRVAAAGGAAIRLIPVDKAGNPVKGALSHDGYCNPASYCAKKTDEIMKEGIQVVSECYLSGALIKTKVELDASKISDFRPDTTCSKRGCASLIEFFYCNPRVDFACRPDGTKPFQTGAQYETSSLKNQPPECDSCPWYNGEAMIARVNSDQALACILNMTFNDTIVQNPIRTENTVETELFGTTLMEGQSVLSMLAGEPNATMSTVRYPWANTTQKEFEGEIDPKGAFELIITLQDSWANPTGGLVGVFAELRHPEVIIRLDNPIFNETTGGFHVIGNVTISGEYRLQLALEPFLIPLGGSPFLIVIAAGTPETPNTLLLRKPEQVVIDAFGQFFFQPRDKFLNYVSSNHEFFDSTPGNRAPGYWIWVVPRGMKDRDTGLPLEPILDKTGFNILRCGADPDPCNGDDPGLDAFVAAFRPLYVGDYYLELQYCDPRTHVSGVQCDADPFAYNHSAMKPPQAPNPCKALPAGKGGARTGLACTIDGLSFSVSFPFALF